MADITAALDGTELPADAFEGVVRMLSDEGVEILAAPHQLTVVTDAGLREIDVGSWSGLTFEEALMS